jgi:hypothetical protein
MKKTILLLTFLFAISLFAQSNYEVLLSRPDITGLTGGTATDLDGIPTVGLAEGTMVAVFDGSETRIYRLTSGTNPESSPGVIRPDDFADPGNTKVWIASLSSDPEETGYTPSGGGGGTTYSVGDFAQGGVVFWVDETGQHGLVCAKEDQNGGAGIAWDKGTSSNTEAHGNGVYAGEMNTTLIVAHYGSDSYTYAAGVCANYFVTEGGVTYGDWYLPSLAELLLIHQNRAIIDATALANGGGSFATYYWSSTEYDHDNSWDVDVINGTAIFFSKGTTTDRVRAVRRF